MKRTGNRVAKLGGTTKKVAGKRIKGKKYGGPLPDYSAQTKYPGPNSEPLLITKANSEPYAVYSDVIS